MTVAVIGIGSLQELEDLVQRPSNILVIYPDYVMDDTSPTSLDPTYEKLRLYNSFGKYHNRPRSAGVSIGFAQWDKNKYFEEVDEDVKIWIRRELRHISNLIKQYNFTTIAYLAECTQDPPLFAHEGERIVREYITNKLHRGLSRLVSP